ncbi:MAG TPA: hypothetical protein VGS27_10310 [Candidatus Sulfotelmatobacter sp.]|nr:hypothetical protein [Candidatus Sulfotelmatobacter sp.]
MGPRLSLLLSLLLVLSLAAGAKEKKDKKKNQMPELILRAQTVHVVIDPEVGEPLDQPQSNAIARDNVEKALTEWGRYRVVMDGEPADLVIAIHTGDDRMSRPTMKGGPIDQRPGVGQQTPSTIRIGGQQGQPPYNDPNMDPNYPQNQRPAQMGNEIGPRTDSFMVYQGRTWGGNSLDSPALWRYEVEHCLDATPQVKAVEEFRKAIAEAEKPKDPKKP